jgi:hypothetical protein
VRRAFFKGSKMADRFYREKPKGSWWEGAAVCVFLLAASAALAGVGFVFVHFAVKYW